MRSQFILTYVVYIGDEGKAVNLYHEARRIAARENLVELQVELGLKICCALEKHHVYRALGEASSTLHLVVKYSLEQLPNVTELLDRLEAAFCAKMTQEITIVPRLSEALAKRDITEFSTVRSILIYIYIYSLSYLISLGLSLINQHCHNVCQPSLL